MLGSQRGVVIGSGKPEGESIFGNLDIKTRESIFKNRRTNLYKKRMIIFLQGNPCYGFYEVLSGKVKISKMSSEGGETVIKIATAGDIIGHWGLFDNNNYTVSAQTLEDSKLGFYDKKYISRALLENPELSKSFITYMFNDMLLYESRIQSLAKKNVREKIAELLVYLHDNFGTTGDDPGRLDLNLSRDEMASIVGVASETLIRLMSEFKDEGLIQKKGKSIYLKNRQKLVEYASMA